MADVTVTAASVAASNNSSTKTATGTAGVTITAGQALYKDSTASNKLKLADASADASAACVGISLNGGALDQPITYVTYDEAFNPGGTIVAGKVYCVSATAGAIAPVADILSTEFVTVLGVAESASALRLVTGANQQGPAIP